MSRVRPLLLCLLAGSLASADDASPSLEVVHTDCVLSVAFAPDGSTAASGDNAGLIRVWSTLSGKELLVLSGHDSHVASIRFTPDGRHLVSGSYDNTVRMWDVATGEEVWRANDHGATVYKVRVTRDGRHFATATTNEIYVWETRTRRRILRLEGADPCAFTADGRYLAAEVRGAAIAVYEIASGARVQLIEPVEGRSISSLVFTPDGRGLVAGLKNGDVVVHDVVSGDRIGRMAGHTDSVRGLAISPDGRLVATGSWDNSVRVWELATGSELLHLAAHTDYVLSVQFSPDGMRLLTGARDRRAILWDLVARLGPSAPSSPPSSPEGAAAAPPPPQFARWWDDLAANDARRAFAGLWALVRAGDRAVEFLAARPELAPRAPPRAAEIRALVRELDASAAARDRALRQLTRYGFEAEPLLVEARRSSDSPEVRRCLGHLLEGMSPGRWRSQDLRLVRVVHALERIGTPAARRLLERLDRDLNPRVGREAGLALRRMAGG